MAPVELQIPARSAYVGVVRLAIASLARGAGLDEALVDDLRIAVSEACANAVLGHESSNSDEPVTVSWEDRGDHVVVEVADRTPPGGMPSEGDTADYRLSLSRVLLESLVDECSIVPRDGGGTRTILTVRHP